MIANSVYQTSESVMVTVSESESESGAKKFALVYSLAVGIPTASILGAILGHYPKNGVRIAHWDDLSGEEGDSGA